MPGHVSAPKPEFGKKNVPLKNQPIVPIMDSLTQITAAHVFVQVDTEDGCVTKGSEVFHSADSEGRGIDALKEKPPRENTSSE
ncbi:hypothetical protein ANCCEY_01580 [Ancylostoma ceylanicum]|uniref:Uncharacterized protein n=1 Tax=Ancylostoma ceylanicum TaxID=53326 RepID=A0A0D6MCP8_9BILA|nr:hypothetical protein ANCCEY_01580 [Ancylostoma ceylanicum]